MKKTRADVIAAMKGDKNMAGWDLRGVDLSRLDLSGANLTGANLTRANLSVANLYRAGLFGADLFGADLSGADLSVANLYRAGLFEANLQGIENYRNIHEVAYELWRHNANELTDEMHTVISKIWLNRHCWYDIIKIPNAIIVFEFLAKKGFDEYLEQYNDIMR